jgi:hypothetical protein
MGTKFGSKTLLVQRLIKNASREKIVIIRRQEMYVERNTEERARNGCCLEKTISIIQCGSNMTGTICV